MKVNKLNKFIVLVCLLLVVQSNIWDNIISQTQASSPIIPSQSLNFDMDIEQYQIKANFDFNSDLKLVTLTLSKNILITDMNIFQGQVNLDTLILTTDQVLLGCGKYQLESISNQNPLNKDISQKIERKTIQNPLHVSKSTLFLINLFFRYIGTTQFKQQGIFGKTISYNVYEFQPELLGKSKQYRNTLQEGKKEIQDQMQKKFLDDEQSLNLDDFTLENLKFFILVDRKTGSIQKIFKDKQMKQELSFQLNSKVKKPIKCQKDVKKVTMKDIEQLLKGAYQNKDKFDLGGLGNLDFN